jgi:chorismate mutase
MSNSKQVRSQLAILREDIDKVDAELLRLLNQRAELVLKVGELKKANNLAVVHADREKILLARLCAENSGPLPKEMVVQLFQQIIDILKQLQR